MIGISIRMKKDLYLKSFTTVISCIIFYNAIDKGYSMEEKSLHKLTPPSISDAINAGIEHQHTPNLNLYTNQFYEKLNQFVLGGLEKIRIKCEGDVSPENLKNIELEVDQLNWKSFLVANAFINFSHSTKKNAIKIVDTFANWNDDIKGSNPLTLGIDQMDKIFPEKELKSLAYSLHMSSRGIHVERYEALKNFYGNFDEKSINNRMTVAYDKKDGQLLKSMNGFWKNSFLVQSIYEKVNKDTIDFLNSPNAEKVIKDSSYIIPKDKQDNKNFYSREDVIRNVKIGIMSSQLNELFLLQLFSTNAEDLINEMMGFIESEINKIKDVPSFLKSIDSFDDFFENNQSYLENIDMLKKANADYYILPWLTLLRQNVMNKKQFLESLQTKKIIKENKDNSFQAGKNEGRKEMLKEIFSKFSSIFSKDEFCQILEISETSL